MGLKTCPRDGFPLELDRALLRATVEAGWPAVELLTCLNGHSVRADAPHLRTGPAPKRPALLCPACGRQVIRVKGSCKKACSDACTKFVATMRGRAYQRGEIFVIEEQPWFRGGLPAARPSTPLPPLDPLAGRMPRDWAVGWGRVHGEGGAA